MSSARLYIMILFAFMSWFNIHAQITLEGMVVSAEDQQALRGVGIYCHTSQTIKTSDEKGAFVIENLNKGLHQFTLYLDEYETITEAVLIAEDRICHFEMRKLSIDLTTVDVVAEKEELFAIKQLNDIEGTSIFAGKKSEVVILDMVKANLAINRGRQIYAQVAGLNIYEGSDGGLQLNLGGRGLDPNRTSNFNTRQNGYDISADVLGYPENYYTPPSEAISEVRIVRGASSLQYGTQFGGLIDFRLRKIPSYKPLQVISTQTVGSFGLFNSFNSVGFTKGKFSFNSFYNYKTGNGYRNNSNFDLNNFFISMNYALSDKTEIGGEFTYFKYLAKQAGGLTDHQFEQDPRMSTRDRNWFDVDWKLYSLNFRHEFSSSSHMSAKVFGLMASRKSVGFRGNPIDLNENPITSIDERDDNGNYLMPRDLIIGEFNNYGAELRFLNELRVAKKKTVLLLGSKYYKSNNTSVQGPGSTGADADFSLYNDQFPDYANQSEFDFPNFNLAFFGEYIVYLSDKLSITPGFRFEHIKTESKGEYNQLIFDNAGNPIANNLLSDDRDLTRDFILTGIGLNYKKSKRIQFVANLSQNYRSVTFSDIRVVSPTFIIDPNISDERGFTSDIGIRGRINKIVSYDLTLYSIKYKDRIGIILDDRANRVRKNIGDAVIMGTESLLNINLARWLSPEERNYKWNVFINTALTTSEYTKSEENNVVGKQVEFVPKANIKTGVNLGYKNFEASYQFSYLSKQYTDAQNSGIADQGDKRSGIVGEIPAYRISDITFSYKIDRFTFTTGVNNLFDKAYFTRRATGYPGPGIIPSEGRAYFLSASYKI